MSEKRIRKSLQHFADIEESLPRRQRTAVIVSDSKGRRLKEQVWITSPIERRIVWLCKAGLASQEGIIWLKSKLSQLKADHGEISIYLFLGTCDFTCKTGDFITIQENVSGKYDRMIDNFHLLSDYAKRKKFEVTFFEIPYYSITEWNRYKGDPMPQVFQNDDHTLCAIVKKVNNAIKEINLENGKHSPVFNCDLERSRKGTWQNERYYLNFSLYADGIHPNPLLAKLWLRRIAAQIKRDCYY